MNPRVLVLVATCLVGMALVGASPLLVRDGAARPGPPVGAPGSGSPSVTKVGLTVEALGVLRSWDGRRAAAWAAGDPRRLEALYVPGSRTGRRDAAMLRAYAGRGLRVTGLWMQVTQADLVRARPGRAVLVVTDRLTGAVAREGARSIGLPRDRPSEQAVTLRRVAGEWRVAEVRRVRP